MKIAVIGGGGVRSIFLAKSLAQRAKELGIAQVAFMDQDAKKLAIYGELAKEASRRLSPGLKFTLTTDPVQAVKDANYIITTIRAGQDHMRIQDEKIALGLGVLGQETTGAAGFSFAMRSVPALVEYCQLAQKHAAPNVKIFNFTNPAGLVSQVLRDLGYDFTYGICDAPSSLLHSMAKLKGVSQDRVTGNCYGLNHLSFFRDMKLDGRDVMDELLHDDLVYQKTDMGFFEKGLAQHLGCLLNEYLYYYYYPEIAIGNILKSGTTRGEVIKEVNGHMAQELSCLDRSRDFEACLQVFEKWYGRREKAYMANETGVETGKPTFRFHLHEADMGGYAGVALNFISAELKGEEREVVLCVPNQGAIPGLRDSDVVEITCTVKNGRYLPHKVEDPGELQMELIRRVKLYERLASEALRTLSISKAVDCLMVHPLVNSYSLARKLVLQYIELNKNYTGEWK